jgi:UDP-N-acetylglucosamine 2-epimerase (non-hydrolysing)
MRARILHLVGARPNFVKMAPLIAALRERDGIENLLAHTGQHYDQRMSAEILHDLELPEPDFHLGVGSGRHGEQTARALTSCEQLISETRPDLLVVAGDVNSTLAGALAAAKMGVPVAHLESGLRSGDWGMPEEINRVLTDRLSDVLLTHSPEAGPNLEREGIDSGRVHLVGNTMIDSLRRFEQDAAERAVWDRLGLAEATYVLVTLHRPSNVDDPERLRELVAQLISLSEDKQVVFPIHPRTRASLADADLISDLEAAGVFLLEPLGYLDFLSLELGAGAVLTDSGGIQEETSALGVRCFTLRANTERPVTIDAGSNVLLGEDPSAISQVALTRRRFRRPGQIPFWDGAAAERAARVLCNFLETGAPRRGDVLVT